MCDRPRLVLVKNTGSKLRTGSRLPAGPLATKERPVKVVPDVVAANLSAAFLLKLDGDGQADTLLGRDGLPQVADRSSTLPGELVALIDREGIEIFQDRVHGATLPVGKAKSIPVGHLPYGMRRQNPGMPKKQDKQDVRLRRLMELRAAPKYAKLNDQEFAVALGIDPTYYSRLKSYPKKGSKRIGDKCRDWEVTAGLTLGWFDQEAGAPPQQAELPELSKGALDVALAYDDFNKAERIRIDKAIADIMRDRDNPKRQTG